MTYTETHSITFTKPSLRRLQDRAINNNMSGLFASVINKGMTVRGWSITHDISRGQNGTSYSHIETPEVEGYDYLYSFHAILTFSRDDDKEPNFNELASIYRTLAKRSGGQAFGLWTLAKTDDEEYVMPGDDDEISANVNADMIGYVDLEMPEDFEKNFSHLFGRDAHVARIRQAIEAAIMSEWNNRFHCALIGPPGCGKSDICRNIKKAFGEEAVMEFDATATTGAGAIKELSEMDILPRILVVEEIEKADPKSLNYLMALCDMRGEIRKTTARTNIQRDVRLLVIATVNDLDLFNSMASGALASRFANKVGFSRPSREQLAMILAREIDKIGGDQDWIKPALDYCEDHDITDPRQVISLCLCGREKLLDGSYQQMLADTAV